MRSRVVKMMVVLGPLLLSSPSRASPDAGAEVRPMLVVVKVARSTVVKLPRKPERIAIEHPSIAALEVLPEGALRITGLRIGDTRAIGRDHAQLPIIIRVKVIPGAPPVRPSRGTSRSTR